MVGVEWDEKLFREAVFEDGLEQGRISAVLNMLKEKLPLEMIARISEMSVEKFGKLAKRTACYSCLTYAIIFLSLFREIEECVYERCGGGSGMSARAGR